jgi:basic amino acid/polyamine antiporter, APA family
MKLISFQKKLSLPAAIAVTVGAVIGVGIFVIVGPIGAKTGGFMPLAFALAAIPAIFGTLASIALGGTIPADGGGYFYSKSLLGPKLGVLTSCLIMVGAMGAASAVAIGIADYIRIYFPNWSRPGLAVLMVVGTAAVNYLGVMASSWFQIFMVVQLVSGMGGFIIAGLLLGQPPSIASGLPAGPGGMATGIILAVLCYTGFNIIGELGDEIENPRRNIPITIAAGLGIVIFLYVGAGWVVSGNLSLAEMQTSPVALVDAALKFMPRWTMHYLNLAAFFAGITSINAVFLAVPRELVALTEDGLLPQWMLRFNPRRQTFTAALLLVTLAGALMVLTNFNPDFFAMICVAGLMLANAVLSLGAFRLFSRFPDQVKTAIFPIRKSWLYPCAALSALLSFAVGGFAVFILVKEFLLKAILG